MIHSDVIVNSPISSKNAAKVVLAAGKYSAKVWIEKDDKTANAKSLLGVISLNVKAGTAIRIYADGVDEQSAVYGLSSLIENDFKEEIV
jgi:phosphotransferase system HPr (HPr) family protein